MTQATIKTTQDLGAFDEQTRTQKTNLAATGVTEIAVRELEQQREKERDLLKNRQEGERRDLEGRWAKAMLRWPALATSLLLAVVGLMILEALIDPAATTGLGARRGQLASARYALIALWIATLLAQPQVLRSVNIVFVGVLLAFALVLVFMPMGWLRKA